eukprot:TRINITY_DN44335_c0_g1_i1.p1 TRINITY_DN44335_c0_g1~~TRINITY_DN44335_c0_g1_i1.p1  ORF type:complete len:401 (-),score=83.40 TRINITY_DN44335_c0_g1_i1:91-1293(-)
MACVEAVLEEISLLNLPADRRCEGLSTTLKLLKNIQSAPHEEKYRTVRTSNPALQSRLFPQCFQLLRAAGFEDSADLLVYKRDPESDDDFLEALCLVESLVMSLGGCGEASSASSSRPPATAGASSTSRSAGYTATAKAAASTPVATAKLLKQQKLEQAKAEAKQSQACAQAQLAELRKKRGAQYQEQQDVALAQHLSHAGDDRPFDPITALNVSRGATRSMISCTRCGISLRYNTRTSAQAVLCPCGMLLQPVHLQGQAFRPQSPSDLPVEPGVPDVDGEPLRRGGPFITVRGPEGPTRLPLHSVLQMVRQHEETRQAGAASETIEALPTRRFDAETMASSGGQGAQGGDENKCQICIEEFADGDELRTLPCFHLFHAACVDQWLKVNSVCPTCRHKVG